jgi:iron complex transport system substrate-binding protein
MKLHLNGTYGRTTTQVTNLLSSALIILFLFFSSMGCRNKSTTETQPAEANATAKTEIKYAKGFNIAYHENYKIVTIGNSFDSSSIATRYILLNRGQPVPEAYKNDVIVEIPIRSIVAMSSMYIGLLELLDSESIITGLSDLKYVYSEKVIQMIEAGKVSEIGHDNAINQEKLVNLRPDLVMTIGTPHATINKFPILQAANIPVMMNSEWVETTPLARAEWVKLMAALLDKEELVNEKFTQIEQEYHRLVSMTKNIEKKPTIISGQNNKDTWFIPGGDSYMAQFFQDAGGSYHWANQKKTGSIAMNFESVYPIALSADYWLHVGYMHTDTRASIGAQDARYDDFKSFKSGNMYNYTHRVNTREANDYFESGNVQPQVVLADLIKILHPDLLPNHTLVYYKKLD